MRLDCMSLGQSLGGPLGLLRVAEAYEARSQLVNLTSALGARPRFHPWGWAFYTVAAPHILHSPLVEAPRNESRRASGVIGL